VAETGAELSVLAEVQLSELRASLKWLVAAAGAVAAVLVAGIQLKDLPAGNIASGALWVAGAATLIALLLVFAFLRAAVGVLTLPRPTASDLTKREQRSNISEVQAFGSAEISDPLVRSLYMQKSYLFSESESIADLYENDYVRARNALKELEEGNDTTWKSRPLKPIETEKAALRATLERSQKQLPILESVAHLELTRSEYRRLINRFPAFGVIFVAAICVFTVASHPSPQRGAAITSPANVRVTVVDRSKAGLPPECRDYTLPGVAVGGTWDKPTVITQSTPQCPSRLIEQGNGILAQPLLAVPPSQPSS
jgi:hypothetical protein